MHQLDDSMYRLFTIGHGNHASGRFFQMLLDREIKVLIDVRSKPYSRRNPQYNRQELIQACRDAKLIYRWMGRTLGGQSIFKPDHPEFTESMRLILKNTNKFRIAMMCSETDPSKCHRTSKLTAWLIRNSKQRILHIVPGGSIDAHVLESQWEVESLLDKHFWS